MIIHAMSCRGELYAFQIAPDHSTTKNDNKFLFPTLQLLSHTFFFVPLFPWHYTDARNIVSVAVTYHQCMVLSRHLESTRLVYEMVRRDVVI